MFRPGGRSWPRAGEAGPRIMAKLPLVQNDGGRFDYPSAYAIGSIDPRPTGDDTSVLFLETLQEFSRARLQTLLKQVGIDAQITAAGQEANKSMSRELLLETTDFVGPADRAAGRRCSRPAGEGVLRVRSWSAVTPIRSIATHRTSAKDDE